MAMPSRRLPEPEQPLLLNPRQLAADRVVSLNIQTTLLWTTLKQIQLAFVVIIEVP